MPLLVLPSFLVRAPLLPVRALRQPAAALAAHPLGEAALALAAGEAARAVTRVRRRYGTRAAFRPTPSGLLAGVATGRLGASTRLATGTAPAARLAPSWPHVAALGRALLDEPSLRAHVSLRAAPSLMRAGSSALWLGFGSDVAAEPAVAEIDELLGAVLDATAAWAPWPSLRAVVAGLVTADDDDIDELLLVLVDQGLVHHDLAPPLVGPEPAPWLLDRLAPVGEPAAARAAARLRDLDERCRGGAIDETDRAAVHAVLVHRPRGVLQLSRAAVERAAALAPLLFRLQDALAPPAAERDAAGLLPETLEAAVEIFGAGAFSLGELGLGGYGAAMHSDGEPDLDAPPPPPALLALLVERLAQAAAAGEDEIRLDAAALDAVLPAAAPPPTFELFLTPGREPRGALPGTGWLLGVHAPGGATWGRFARALGHEMEAALAALADAERVARPGERHLDVAYAPNAALGDVTGHPPVREATFALSAWSAGPSVTPADLELVADPGALEPLALRLRDGTPVVPSPLHRVRGTTAPAGVFRLLCGWSLHRQHAPWAFTWGPLAALPRLPRVSIDGFVVAPASFRLPPRDALARRGAVARWRRESGAPALVQVGHEDELLPVDLAARDAAEDLAGEERAFEIWPPLSRLPDADGRRVEAVVAVAAAPDGPEAATIAAALRGTREAGRVPAPREEAAPSGWTTFKLFGAQERQNRVLLGAVAPVVVEARGANEIDRWFFIRYVDGPGRRAHLRVRVRGSVEAFAARLAPAADAARAAGDVVTIETTPYHREVARFGGSDVMDVVEQIFQSDSDLACDLLGAGDAAADGEDGDVVELSVRSLDTLAAALGLPREERRALARRRRDATAGAADDDDVRAEYRRRQRRLMTALDPGLDDGAGRPLAEHMVRVARAAAVLPPAARDRVIAPLLHLAVVRLAGPDAAIEARAYTLWERACEGLVRRNARR